MTVTVRVKPGARVASVREEDGVLVVATPAHPERGKANEAVLKLVAAHLGVAPSRLALLRGATGRTKQFRVL